MSARMASALLIVLAGSACSHHAPSAESASPARDTPVSIEVENHNWSDMVIFLERGNLSQRLGSVTSQTTGIFTITYFQLGTTGSAQLRADPVGALKSFSSEAINIQPGQSIKWTIENDIARSFLAVY